MNPLNQPIIFHLSEQRERMNESIEIIEMGISRLVQQIFGLLEHIGLLELCCFARQKIANEKGSMLVFHVVLLYVRYAQFQQARNVKYTQSKAICLGEVLHVLLYTQLLKSP